MVEEDTACPDVLVQIAVVRAALNAAAGLIIEDHMQGCMVKPPRMATSCEEAFRDQKTSLDRFID